MRARGLAGIATAAALAAGCTHPMAIVEDRALVDVARRYRDFFPPQVTDFDAAHDAALLRPRFGLPAVGPARAPFALEVLSRGARPSEIRAALVRPDVADAAAWQCARGDAAFDGCYPLALEPVDQRGVGGGVDRVRLSAHTALAPPDGGYDLAFLSGVDGPVRAPRAVWVRAFDPGAPMRIAHLSDLHVGKSDDPIEERLARVIADVDALGADVVVVSGDIVHRGDNPALWPRARDLLLQLHAPVIAIMGNHDLGFGVVPNLANRYGAGWVNFARTFHPFLLFEVTVGNYDFVAFDSGPSTVSPRILTRGIADETVDAIADAVDRAREAHRAAVVLVSHAPTRASMFESARPTSAGLVGQMLYGARELERVMLDAADRGQRVIHLAGHTHWTEVFQSAPVGGKLAFVRWPSARLTPCPQKIDGEALIVVAQSATRSGLTRAGRGFGWDLLAFDGPIARPTLLFRRFGAEASAATCLPPDERAHQAEQPAPEHDDHDVQPPAPQD